MIMHIAVAPRMRGLPRRARGRPGVGIVLRVRLIGGDHLDVSYEEPDTAGADKVTEHVISGACPGLRRASRPPR
jgi:hypothetical protein